MSSSQPEHSARAVDDELLIEPANYEPPSSNPRQRRAPDGQQLGVAAALLLALLLIWFLLSSRSLELRLVPADAGITVSGGPSLRIGDRLLLRPGKYRVLAQAEGYVEWQRDISVASEDNPRLDILLDPLPGLLELRSTPQRVNVELDGQAHGDNTDGKLEIAAGKHELLLHAPRYQPLRLQIEIEGRRISQTLEVELQPDWGIYPLDSAPTGATVMIDGQTAGNTPLDLELLSGAREIVLALDGYANASLGVVAVAGERRALGVVQLTRADAKLTLASKPQGASITVDGVYQGTTPLTVALDSTREHALIAFKAGHQPAERKLRLGSGQTQEMVLELRPLSGSVRIELHPADAEIRAAGRLLGRGSQTLTLPVGTRELELSREGYATQRVAVTPRPGFTQSLRVRLLTQQEQKMAAFKPRITTSIGQELVLIHPVDYTMGSSRREPERRANEALRAVSMQRMFYLGVAEVTNAEYRRYKSAHSSGNFKGKSLNGEAQPVVNVGWQDAALYCNWLSRQDGLKAFYTVEEGIVTGPDPDGATGYRLPTEAEWEWAARSAENGSLMRFSWGAAMPPPRGSGNFADTSAASILGELVPKFDDSFPVSAPVKRFAANRFGLFDMAGNAAEWVHDYYEAAATGASTPDPLGPDVGEYHVIRGSSWRHGGATELRLSYRDYGGQGRPDVGFRIARYVK